MSERELLMDFVMRQYELGFLFTNAPQRVYSPVIDDFLKERQMNWTSSYPTQPGYYWMRNVVLSAAPRRAPVLKPEAVLLVSDPDGFLRLYRIRDASQWCVGDFLSAEWLGPIQPPQENEWRRGVVPSTRCAWCQTVTDRLVHWSVQGPDGFYHGAMVCRECYDKKMLTPQEDK